LVNILSCLCIKTIHLLMQSIISSIQSTKHKSLKLLFLSSKTPLASDNIAIEKTI
jgi:hypothetical protein